MTASGCSTNSSIFLGTVKQKIRVTFHILPLQLQIKVGCQPSVQFFLRFESSEEVAWGREQFESSGEGTGVPESVK